MTLTGTLYLGCVKFVSFPDPVVRTRLEIQRRWWRDTDANDITARTARVTIVCGRRSGDRAFSGNCVCVLLRPGGCTGGKRRRQQWLTVWHGMLPGGHSCLHDRPVWPPWMLAFRSPFAGHWTTNENRSPFDTKRSASLFIPTFRLTCIFTTACRLVAIRINSINESIVKNVFLFINVLQFLLFTHCGLS